MTESDLATLLGLASSALLLGFVMWKTPAAITPIWLVGVAVVPPWIYPTLHGVRIPPAAVLSLCVLAATRPSPRPGRPGADIAVASMCAVAVLDFLIGGTPIHVVVQVVAEWGLCYAAGRRVVRLDGVVKTARLLGAALGLVAVTQTALQFNVADVTAWAAQPRASFWMPLQERGGLVRSELTFGHSISLGGTLALLLPFAVWRRRGEKLSNGYAVLIVAGIISTFSRGSLLAGISVIALVVLCAPQFSKATKALLVSGLAAIAISAWSTFNSHVSESGYGKELSDSSSYREDLLNLIGIVRPVGLAPGGRVAPDGVTYTWQHFYSIDNALLYVALYTGFLTATLYVIAIYLAARKSNSSSYLSLPTVLLVAQVPLILTVAPITQYQNFFWFMVGLCVATRDPVPNSVLPRLEATSANAP